MTYKTRMKCIHHTFRVNGELNGVSIIAQDLNCYVVTEDGRTYTAISRISEKLGWQMQGKLEDNKSKCTMGQKAILKNDFPPLIFLP